jgi:hypothetical protein
VIETDRTSKHRKVANVNPLRSLAKYGQAVWLDCLARGSIAKGGLKKLVEENGLTGITSSPSIFEKAPAGSSGPIEAAALLQRDGRHWRVLDDALEPAPSSAAEAR